MYLYGASGHAKVIIDILKSRGIAVEGIFDDNDQIKNLLGYTVHGPYDQSLIGNGELIISIGNNLDRSVISKKLPCRFGSAAHSSAIISGYSSFDEGTVIMHGAIVQSDSSIGKHVIVNSSSIIEHDCVIGDYVHISPHATICGNVKIGEGTHVGAGAVIIPGVKIGRWSIIGAGSVIIRDVQDNVVVAGNPGKVIKSNIG